MHTYLKNQKIKNQKIKNKNNDRINISLWRSSHTPPLLVKRGINITGQIMKLILIRRYKNADYIRGELYIENPECKICDTLENAAIHAPAGEYDLSYQLCKQLGRKLPKLCNTYCQNCKFFGEPNQNKALPRFCPMIMRGNGVHNRFDGRIIVGKYLTRGAVVHTADAFNKIKSYVGLAVEMKQEMKLEIIEAENN